jgi:hypothetical protein
VARGPAQLEGCACFLTTSKYWANLGLDDIYHTYAAVLEVNDISPHQVLLEAHIDIFGHQDASDAIAAVAAKFLESDASDLAGSP